MTDLAMQRGFATIANHLGEHDEARFAHTMPIYQTSTFGFVDGGDARNVLSVRSGDRFVYTRGGNPNSRHLARKIAHLEGLDILAANPRQAPDELVAGEVTASGLAAITTLAFALLHAGDTAIVQRRIYGGALGFWEQAAPRHGIDVVFVESGGPDAWAEAAEANPTAKILYLETPSTPKLESYDIAAVASIADRIGARLVVDNSAATPFHQRPLGHGADFVVISTTKYINGHGTQIGGAIATRHAEEMQIGGRVWAALAMYGGIPSPMDCWQTNNGLKTLELRMERHARNAMAIARFLEAQNTVSRVYYPGLETMPDHAVAKRQMHNGFGGLVSFEVGETEQDATRFLNALRLPIIASSFGTTDTLVQQPYLMNHSYMDDAQKRRAGITRNLIRMSVGVECIDDLLDDIACALRLSRL